MMMKQFMCNTIADNVSKNLYVRGLTFRRKKSNEWKVVEASDGLSECLLAIWIVWTP